MQKLNYIFPTVLIAAFFVMQCFTLNYGTKINDIDFIAEAKIQSSPMGFTGSDRHHSDTMRSNSDDFQEWLTRYKLYSIEADEIVSLMALSRMSPQNVDFDPEFYQYGGSWIYALGFWYYTLDVLSIYPKPSLETLLSNPDLVDQMYIYGRLFVLISVCLSAFVLFKTCTELTSPSKSIILLFFYLTTPAIISYSQIMKPHWYALFWANMSLLYLIRANKGRGFHLFEQLITGMGLGLAVGASLSFGLFAIGVLIAVLYLVSRKKIEPRATFIIIMSALFMFCLTNPFLLLNTLSASAELDSLLGWYQIEFKFENVFYFFKNSLVYGFGIGFLGCFFLALWVATRGNTDARALMFLSFIFLVIFIMSMLTSSMSNWQTNYRYCTYLLPLLIYFVAVYGNRIKIAFLIFGLTVNISQAAPLKAAYFDENDPLSSTRQSSALWINRNIPIGAAICVDVNSIAPYDLPPFDFRKYKLKDEGCQYLVKVQRHIIGLTHPNGYQALKSFKPRFFNYSFPMVFEHINPVIFIYQFDNAALD